jgi:hypothetical protein
MRVARVNDILPLAAGPIEDDRLESLPESSRLLLARWQQDRQGTAVPSAAWIDPLHLWPWLGHLVVTERVHERYRYRIFGSEIAVNAGYDLSGTWMDQNIETETTALFRPQYDATRAAGTPLVAQHIRLSAGVKITRLVLPYSRHGSVDTVVTHYTWTSLTKAPAAPQSSMLVSLPRLRSWRKL